MHIKGYKGANNTRVDNRGVAVCLNCQLIAQLILMHFIYCVYVYIQYKYTSVIYIIHVVANRHATTDNTISYMHFLLLQITRFNTHKDIPRILF